MKLTPNNYYSHEANVAYQSATWFKKFMSCEAEAVAELNGTWVPDEDDTPLLVGNYVHSYFESPESHKHFIEDHPQIFSSRGPTKGELKSQYQVANKMIAALDSQPLFHRYYTGEREAILTGAIDGIPWMGKLDCLPPNKRYFCDVKTTRDFATVWNEKDSQREHFIQNYRYFLQMAVYQELVRQNYGSRAAPIIFGVTKEKVPAKGYFRLDKYQDELDEQLSTIKLIQPHVEAVKRGEIKPVRCEQCDYCKTTQTLLERDPFTMQEV